MGGEPAENNILGKKIVTHFKFHYTYSHCYRNNLPSEGNNGTT
jgi:hypothetical protein